MGASTDPAADLSALLRRVEAHQGVSNLLAEVCHAIDGPDGAAWAALYTDDGVFGYTSAPGGEKLFELRGRASLIEWHAHHRANTPVGKQNHLTLNSSIAVDGDAATAASTFVSLREVNGVVVPASSGRYEDRFRREPDGAWRLVERQAIGDMPRKA